MSGELSVAKSAKQAPTRDRCRGQRGVWTGLAGEAFASTRSMSDNCLSRVMPPRNTGGQFGVDPSKAGGNRTV